MSLRLICRDRIDVPESFDDEHVPPARVDRYLRDLEKVNRYLLGIRSIVDHVAPLLAHEGAAPFRVLDIGCGGGEVLRALATRARRAGRALHGVGLDRNRTAAAYARSRSHSFPELTWLCGDAFALPFLPASFDVVISTTLLHHFGPGQAAGMLRGAADVSRGRLVISDLIRSHIAAEAFRAFSYLMRFCPESRADGLISVRRAYRPEELAELAKQAGLSPCHVCWYPFARMALVCGPLEEHHGA